MGNEVRKSWNPPGMVPAGTPSGAPEAVGIEASWERHRPEATSVDPRDVKPFSLNASVVLHNVRAGVAAVLGERPWFERQPDAPRVDFGRVASAETAAEALVFTAGRAAAVGREAPTLRKKIVRGRALVRTLQGAAQALVEGGVLDAAALPRVDGRGPLATAQACVAYASLFRGNHAKTRGATAVKPALVREAAELGSELLREVKPRGVGTRGARTESERVAADDRDRMGVVVTRLYDYVERVAAWRWGRSCEAIVPPMASRALPRGEAAEDEALDDDAADEDVAGGDDESAADGTDDAGEGADEEPAAPVATKGEPDDDTTDDDDAVIAASKPKKAAAKAAPAKKPAKKGKR